MKHFEGLGQELPEQGSPSGTGAGWRPPRVPLPEE